MHYLPFICYDSDKYIVQPQGRCVIAYECMSVCVFYSLCWVPNITGRTNTKVCVGGRQGFGVGVGVLLCSYSDVQVIGNPV